MREIYFHEDDYCQIELVAENGWEFSAKQMVEINEFSDQHKDGAGWTAMFMRKEVPIPLSSLAIGKTELTNCMHTSMPPFDRVLTGYSTYREVCQNTMAFGQHESLALFAEFDPNGIVTSVWFAFELVSPEEAMLAEEVMKILARWPVAVADWGWSALIRANDAASLRQYFIKRAEVFGKIMMGSTETTDAGSSPADPTPSP